MKFDYIEDFDPNSIDVNTKEGFYAKILSDWEKTDKSTIKFSASSESEKKRCYGAVRGYIVRKGHDWTMYCEKGKPNIYVVRSIPKERKS